MTSGAKFEGWWEPVSPDASPRLRGKIEWEPSSGGGTEVDVLLRNLDLADGEEIEIVSGDRVVMRAQVERGKVRHTIRSADGHSVPDLGGKTVELTHRGAVLGRAVMEPD